MHGLNSVKIFPRGYGAILINRMWKLYQISLAQNELHCLKRTQKGEGISQRVACENLVNYSGEKEKCWRRFSVVLFKYCDESHSLNIKGIPLTDHDQISSRQSNYNLTIICFYSFITISILELMNSQVSNMSNI